MRERLILILLYLISLSLLSCSKEIDTTTLKEGDIIFQESVSRQSAAIQLATHSRYSHMGIIFKQGDYYLVLEAVQPVKFTPLDEWINRGKRRHYVVKRLKDTILDSIVINKMKATGEQMVGKKYDIYFGWSDERIYCSELVWKIYNEALGIEIGPLKKMKDFDLTHERVKEIMEKRYGKNIPLDETVVSPGDIFDSDKLVTIEED
ncbi:MAG: YiiX family permuted papain-like enzyme [Ignavibacteriae bacterium]|nr:YiiX family permuted papain-like enzyme [Ignavibacteriota bacterium]MCB9244454.1 YiiX family permuted papain-like enzyme [Ignavibacteriales bacterium]